MRSRIPICIFFVFLGNMFWRCNSNTSNLERALETAKKNRVEFEKVLAKYSTNPDDSLKYQAAVFLIENMPGYFYYDEKSVIEYSNYFKGLRSSTNEPAAIMDSIAKIKGNFRLQGNRIKYDITTIDSAYLCENIELSFQAWRKYPWSKEYDFGAFCKYILPYRIGNEMLTNWRSLFLENYSSIIDSVLSSDPIEVARLLRDSVISILGYPRFTLFRPAGYPTIDAITSQQLAGTCDDLTQFSISLFRTFGIAVSEDYIPLKGDSNVGHSWVSIHDINGDLYNTDFFGEILYVSETSMNRSISKPKVYRKSFSVNDREYTLFSRLGVEVPGSLFNYANRSIDVTKQYSNNLIDLKLSKEQLYDSVTQPPIAFLCAPSWLQWIPVAWNEVGNDGSISFKEIDGGTLLRVAYFEQSEIKFLSAPFFIHKQSREIIFIGDADFSETSNTILYSKFSVARDEFFTHRLIDGRFEGADNVHFENPNILYVIKDSPARLFTEVLIDPSNKYKYLRYVGSDGSHCNISEIEFFSDTSKIVGDVIGTPNVQGSNPNYNYTAAFDGRTETSFNHSSGNGGWTGLQLSSLRSITKIRYAPANYGNFIEEGNDYELFVSTREGWRSFGRQIADSDSLMFFDVPTDALLYLKNHTQGQDERPFRMRDNQQEFF